MRPLVLICPGGAYRFTADREAEMIALHLNSAGYHAAVLRYSCAPAIFPTALLEVAESIKLLKEKAEEWHIDTEKVFVMGFSAVDILRQVMEYSGIVRLWQRKQESRQKS